MKAASDNERSILRFAFVALAILSLSLLTGKAYEQTLQAVDSSLHARLALDVTGGAASPVLPMKSLDHGYNESGFNDHPFLLFYLNGWMMRLFGADAWSARFLPSLFGVGCIGLVSWLGALLYSPIHGLGAGIVLLVSLPFANYVSRFQLDPAMIFFILLSFIGWKKRNPYLMGISAGVGIWMKSVVALLVFPSAVLSLVFERKLTWKELRLIILGAVLAVATGSLVWIYSGHIGGIEVVKDYWYRQVYGTAIGGRSYSTPYDLSSMFLFTEALRRRYWPWLPFLIFSLVQMIRYRRWKTPEVSLPLAATLVVLVTISAMRFKFDHYYLPMYPFLALLVVDGLRKWIQRKQVTIAKSVLFSGLLIPGVLISLPIELSPEMFPALKRFAAIIQSYGSCKDKVLYIDGEQPYGSATDYSPEIGFYTNRQFISSGCGEAQSFVEREKPSWILVFGGNKDRCLSAEIRSRYRVQYQFGNQFLLAKDIPLDGALNLTPLARELRAPLNCEAVPLPRNRYNRYLD